MSEYWGKLSERERRLALATVAVIVVAFALMMVFRAVTRIRELDHAIGRLEDAFMNYKRQEARGVSVDKAFAQVAAQHSSAWTEAEIHNRLREEIYRLQLEDPDAPPESGKKLVEIPTLRQGTLKDGGAGYREYQLSIKIPSSDVYSVIIFLMRLQQSQQTLRIDGLDIARAPESQLVSATINVTRTVVSGAPAAEGETPVAQKQEPPLVDWDGSRMDDWRADGCEVAAAAEIGEMAASGGSCLKAQAQKAEASVFMVREVDGGATYELTTQVAATGKAQLRIVNDSDGKPLEGEQELTGDGQVYRYRMAFTAPGEAGSKLKLRVPAVTIPDAGTVVYVDNVTLRKVTE